MRFLQLSAFFILLLTASFAATTQFDMDLNHKYYYFKTDGSIESSLLAFTFTKILQAGASDSLNGAVICAGHVAAASDINGTWAKSKFNASSSFFIANDWKALTSKAYNRPIKFVSRGDFGLIIPDIYDLSGTPVYYNFLSPLVTSSEPLTYLREGDIDDVNPNKEGMAAVICAGQNSLSFYKNNALQASSVADIYEGSNSNSFSANSVGQYRIETTFPTFSCFGATKTINYPSADPDFAGRPLNPYVTIYGPDAGFKPTTPTSTISFTVKDPKFLPSTSKYFPTGTMEIKPSSNTQVYLRVTNNGVAGKDVGIKVTGVSLGSPSTTGFTVSPVSSAQVMDPLKPGSMINNMYNKEIAPGTSGIIAISVNSPSVVPKNSNIKIKLNIQATSLTCADLPSGQTFEFTNTTTDIPVEPGTDLASCEFSPANADALPNEVLSYNLTCFNATGSVIACTGANTPDIAVAPSQYAVLAATPSQIAGPKTLVKVKAIAEGWALITASREGATLCAAVIDVNNANQAQSCEFVPSSGTVGALQQWTYRVRCYDKKLSDPTRAEVPCSDTPGYSLDVSPANLVFSNVPSGSSMVLTPAAPGKLTLTAGSQEAVHPFTCTATLTATDRDFNSCSIEPAQWNTTSLDQYGFFALNCYNNGVRIACPYDQNKVDINFTKNVATLVSYAPTGTNMQSVIVVLSESYNNGVMTVTDKATKASCSANINVQSSTANNCVLIPNAGFKDVGQKQSILINCTENTNKVQCAGVVWSSSGASATLAPKSNTAAVATFNAPGASKITATVTSQSGAPATYNCTADFLVSGVYGNLCQVSPISADLNNGSNQRFNVSCYNFNPPGRPVAVPCLDVGWTTTVPQAVLAPVSGSNSVIGSFPEIGTGIVRATVGVNYPSQRYSCVSNVTVQASTDGVADRCILSGPSSVTKDAPFDVGITCYNGETNNVIPCIGVEWRLRDGFGTISGDDAGAVASISANDTIDVLLNGKDGCLMDVGIGGGSGDGTDIGGSGDCDSLVAFEGGTSPEGMPIWTATAICNNAPCAGQVEWFYVDGTPLGLGGNNPLQIPITSFGGSDSITIRAKVDNVYCPNDEEIEVASICRPYI